VTGAAPKHYPCLMINPNDTFNTISALQSQSSEKNDGDARFKHELLKISADVHAASYSVCVQVENAAPKPPRKMSPKAFVQFVGKELKQARHVVVCYEAGPTGFWVARKLIEMGAHCVVVRPCRLDAYGRRVRNDRTDVIALAERLDRYVAGSPNALAAVAIPSAEQELTRAQSRQCDFLRKQRQAIAAHGRGQMLLWGVRARGQWWKKKGWEELCAQLTVEQQELLQPLIETLKQFDERLKQGDRKLEAEGEKRERPKGAGARTLEQIDREICDWNRFTNRKQPAAYAGLCGGVDATGGRHADLPITKAGNRRLRSMLVEMAWRLVRWQPDCPLIQRWKHVLLDPKAHGRGRKKAIVAVARRLIVDLWRWRTGRVTAEQLGWKMMDV